MPDVGSTPRYCVIGAGASGLATIRELRDRGVEFDCFEKTGRVGGHWHTDYECLHLITARDVSGFEGYAMPDSFPPFPSRAQVVEYLESYAAVHGLYDCINFHTEVEELTPLGPAGAEGWVVRTSDGDQRRYQGVIVCNGHLWDPLIPTYPGEFTGKVLHSGTYHDLSDIEGERVLVVGAGNSGCDIAVELAHARKETLVSMRTGQLFQPKTLFGRPRAVLPLAKLPPRLNELATVALMHVMHGPPSRYGMPTPASWWLRDTRPVVNSQLLHWIHHGRVTIAAGIDRFAGNTVHFVDGSSREIDTLVWATGFNVTFPFLDDGLLAWRAGVPLRHAATTVPVGLDRLYFVGLGAPRGAQLPTYNIEARLVAQMLRISERTSVSFHKEFGQREQPEWRIDMMPHEWRGQVKRAEQLLGRLAQGTGLDVPPHDKEPGATALSDLVPVER